MGILKALTVVAVPAIGALAFLAWENYTTRRCDACRIESRLTGRITETGRWIAALRVHSPKCGKGWRRASAATVH